MEYGFALYSTLTALVFVLIWFVAMYRSKESQLDAKQAEIARLINRCAHLEARLRVGKKVEPLPIFDESFQAGVQQSINEAKSTKQ